MYLKAIELHGFKSFADKTVINLVPGIVGVVGPNGSGKSNIVEAVRWVLGEQRAKSLRGRKMEDVIFNGTGKRKPLGVAEVSLILDNSDYGLPSEFTEIKVTRRLYRSGEGEYLINNKYCRLKDIRTLFEDSGIGGDGCSIIGQGRINELLIAKPEERRSIVEETAGIVKYRERKKEALRKMEGADQNLDRLEDIMTEIESRLVPLKRDAENAKQYAVYKGELDETSITLFAADIMALQEKLAKLTEKEKQADAAYQQAAGLVMSSEAELAAGKATIDNMNDECDALRHSLFDTEKEINTIEGEIKALQSRSEGYEEKQALIDSEIDSLSQRKENLDNILREEEAKYNTVCGELQTIGTRLSELAEKHISEAAGLAAAEKAMEELRAAAFEQTRLSGEKRNQRLALEEKQAGVLHRKKNAEEKIDRYRMEAEVLENRMAEITAVIDSLDSEAREYRGKIDGYNMEIAACGEKIKVKQSEILAAKVEAGRCESRLKTLEELTVRREGFYPGVRGVLEAKSKQRLQGIVGVVGELIQVEKEYAPAIEGVLGSGLQNIVTVKGKDAAAAVGYLKKERKGFATFLPLDMLNIGVKKNISSAIADSEGFLGSALDHVTSSRQVQPALQYLLRNTLVFSTIDQAVAVARKNKGEFRFVSLDGDIVSSGGAVSGGSRDNKKAGILSRKSEIEELRRTIMNLHKEEQNGTSYIEEIEEKIENILKKQAEANKKYNSFLEEQQSFDGEIKNIDARMELYNNEEEVLLFEIDEIDEELVSIKEKLAVLAEEIANSTAEEERLMGEITKGEESFKAAKDSENKGRDEYGDVQVEYASKKAAAENSSVQLERLKNEFAETVVSLNAKLAEKEQAALEFTSSSTEREKLRERVILLNRGLEQAKENAALKEHDRDAFRSEIDALTKSIQDYRREESKCKEVLHNVSLEKERALVEKEQQENRLSEQYQIAPDEALSHYKEDLSLPEARETIKKLKRLITMLGPINHGAVEEYDTVKERYDFLSAQRDDILTAKASLENIVAQMDATITEKFKETFDKINESFKETFPGFFRGGYGELKLTEPDNLLTTGVEMVVQPPGKRVTHHGLLSGGEQALTGIALLFALLKVKPSPFYVFDEIDAALDDVNVDKFGSYLAEYGKDSQFLVITHRQGAMEAASTLYGVTMVEEGVTKTVSVKLDTVETKVKEA